MADVSLRVAMEGAQEAQRGLNNLTDQVKTLADTEQDWARVRENLARIGQEYRKSLGDQTKAAEELKARTAELVRAHFETAEASSKLAERTGAVSKVLGLVSGQLPGASALFGSLQGHLKDVSSAANDSSIGLEAIAAQSSKLGLILAGGVVAALAGVGYMLGKAVLGNIELYDSYSKLSEKTGLSVEELTGYRLALEESNMSSEQFAHSLRFLERNMEASRNKGSEASRAFTALGIATVEASGNLRPVDDVLLDLAERFSTMEDGAGKTALAMAVFGRAGQEIIPFLNKGKVGLQELKDEAKKLGLVISTETAKSAQEFKDNIKAVETASGELARALVDPLLPSLGRVAEAMRTAKKDGEGFFGMLQEGAKQSYTEGIDAFARGLRSATFGIIDIAPQRVDATYTELRAMQKDIDQRSQEIISKRVELEAQGLSPEYITRRLGPQLAAITRARQEFERMSAVANIKNVPIELAFTEGIDVGGPTKTPAPSMQREKKEMTAEERRRIARETAQFEAEQDELAAQDYLDLLQQQLSLTDINAKERLEIRKALAAEESKLREQDRSEAARIFHEEGASNEARFGEYITLLQDQLEAAGGNAKERERLLKELDQAYKEFDKQREGEDNKARQRHQEEVKELQQIQQAKLQEAEKEIARIDATTIADEHRKKALEALRATYVAMDRDGEKAVEAINKQLDKIPDKARQQAEQLKRIFGDAAFNMVNVFGSVHQSMSSVFGAMLRGATSVGDGVKSIWRSMVDAITNELGRLLANDVFKLLFGIGPGGLFTGEGSAGGLFGGILGGGGQQSQGSGGGGLVGQIGNLFGGGGGGAAGLAGSFATSSLGGALGLSETVMVPSEVTGLLEANQVLTEAGVNFINAGGTAAGAFSSLGIPYIGPILAALQLLGGGGGLGKALGSIGGAIGGLASGVGSAVGGVLGGVGDAVGGVLGGLGDVFGFQHGGEQIVTRPTLFKAGELGPERVRVSPMGVPADARSSPTINFHAPVLMDAYTMRKFQRLMQG